MAKRPPKPSKPKKTAKKSAPPFPPKKGAKVPPKGKGKNPRMNTNRSERY